jgi:hypothetical protein
MATWAELEAAAPELAETGRALLYRHGTGSGLLATVRDDAPPRIHPITVAIADGHLYAFILASSKRGDLERDGRYALHSHLDAAAPNEFALRGRAHAVGDPVRSAVAREWAFEVDDGYELFEFSIDSALVGSRPTAEDWPPVYTVWRSPSA